MFMVRVSCSIFWHSKRVASETCVNGKNYNVRSVRLMFQIFLNWYRYQLRELLASLPASVLQEINAYINHTHCFISNKIIINMSLPPCCGDEPGNVPNLYWLGYTAWADKSDLRNHNFSHRTCLPTLHLPDLCR